MKESREIEFVIEGPKVRTHEKVCSLITAAREKIQKAYEKHGGGMLALYEVRVGMPKNIGVEVNGCPVTRHRAGFILTFVPVNQEDDPAIVRRAYEEMMQESDDENL